jgi:hypothetical protein
MGAIPMRCRHCKQGVHLPGPAFALQGTADKPLSADALGKAGDAETTCKPGYLTPGMSFPRRVSTPEGAL